MVDEADVLTPRHFHGDDRPRPSWRKRLLLTAGAVGIVLLNAAGVVTSIAGIDTTLLVALLAGYRLVGRAVKAIRAGTVSYDVTIAVAAAVAIAARQYLAAAEVVLIVLAGDALEHWAIHRADAAIANLLSIQPDRATVIRDGREVVVAGPDVELTDRVLVRGGERVPVDGIVVDGHGAVDQSLITGESMAAAKARVRRSTAEACCSMARWSSGPRRSATTLPSRGLPGW
jgi:Cd2+/Zn2+-exporting ATPase